MAILEYNSYTNSFYVNYKELNNKIFKLLPIYEGKSRDSDIILDKAIAFNNFTKNLQLLCVQIDGVLNKIEIHNNLLEISLVLEGLKRVDIDSHDIVRGAILHCTRLLNEIGG